MRARREKKIFYLTFLVLALMALSTFSVHGLQTISAKAQITQPIPPPPATIPWTYQGPAYTSAVAVSEDGGTVVASFGAGKVCVFGRQSNTTIWSSNLAPGNSWEVAVSANGSTIVVGGFNKIRVFGRQNNATLWSYDTGAGVIYVAVSADGNTIVAGGYDNKIHVFSRLNNSTLWSYNTGAAVSIVAVSDDGKTIVAGGMDYKIHAFARQSNATLWNYYLGSKFIPLSMGVSADGRTIAVGSNDSYLRVFGRNSNTTLWTYHSTGVVWGSAVSRDGTTISAGDIDGHFEVFNRASNTTLLTFIEGGPISNVVATSSDGSVTAFGSWNGPDSKAYLFSKTLGLLWDYGVPDSIYSPFTPNVGISGDGSLIAYGCSDNKLYVFQYDSTPPVLGTPSVTPSSPVGGQSLTISVSATDNIAVSTVTLYYWNTTTSSWSSVPMTLSGPGYKATIGPFSAGDIVAYYISASDTSGNTAYSPSDAPLSYYTLTIGTSSGGAPAPLTESLMYILLGAGLGAVIVVVGTLVLMRGKRSRR